MKNETRSHQYHGFKNLKLDNPVSAEDNIIEGKILSSSLVHQNYSLAHQPREAIVDVLNDWELTNRIEAICFDTTSVNTGQYHGTCKLLENHLNKIFAVLGMSSSRVRASIKKRSRNLLACYVGSKRCDIYSLSN
ncbi:hypothetical protein EVAR_98508_1 [Eumeta japonica]|uniref:Uncharacterized protein n=1 Tax=Eumeta variegata TaxID=151549 RepID=A0A4C2A8R2_EUMVA|nr:hypothetical protein EVAR_98508_1 [Eumeta japonica]